ncbi:MAG: hypothetical protein MJZ37_04420 [Bacilli bacterium]|nr:hypothetical protein [Bacilli bacterium]
MDFNTLLLRLGISPDNFINKEGDAIQINKNQCKYKSLKAINNNTYKNNEQFN